MDGAPSNHEKEKELLHEQLAAQVSSPTDHIRTQSGVWCCFLVKQNACTSREESAMMVSRINIFICYVLVFVGTAAPHKLACVKQPHYKYCILSTYVCSHHRPLSAFLRIFPVTLSGSVSPCFVTALSIRFLTTHLSLEALESHIVSLLRSQPFQD